MGKHRIADGMSVESLAHFPDYILNMDATPAPGREWVAEPDPTWAVPSEYKKCRYGRVCPNPPVADLNRGRRAPNGGHVDSYWAYCADHLFGRWIENGAVMVWTTRPVAVPE